MVVAEQVRDAIEQTLEIAASRERVWAALTEPDQLQAWWADGGAEVDLRPGGSMTLGWSNGASRLILDEVIPPSRLVYRWVPGMLEKPDQPLDSQPLTTVQLDLESLGDGHTQLTVRESGFASMSEADRAVAFTMNSQGWAEVLGILRSYLGR